MRCTFVLSLALLCLACEREPRTVQVRLVPPESSVCVPDEVTQIALDPLGDSPRGERPFVRLDLSEPTAISTVPSFPPDVQQIAVRVEGRNGTSVPWSGGGFAFLEGEMLTVPILPLRRTCVLSDMINAFVPPGAALAALSDGRLLIAGGVRGVGGLRLVLVQPGREAAEIVDFSRRLPFVQGTVTPLSSDLVLVAGGNTELDGGPRNLFEVVRFSTREVEDGFLPSRRQHGATLLPDGRVLLVAGADVAGLRTDAELLEVLEDGTVPPGLEVPAVPRLSPSVLRLDDGTVIVIGGTDEAGTPSSAVERFDPVTSTLVPASSTLAPVADAVHVALAGARIARVGPASIEVLLIGEDHIRVLDVDVPWGGRLEEVRAVGLPDGRLLVVGRPDAGTGPTHYLVDPGGSRTIDESLADPIAAPRSADHLVALRDGVIAEGDTTAVALLRVDLKSPFHNPPPSISPGQSMQMVHVSLDGPGGWESVDGALVSSRPGARFDVPRARFLDFSLGLDVEGEVTLLLTRDGAPPLTLSLRSPSSGAEVRFGACAVPVRAQEMVPDILVERVGDTLRLTSDGAVTCALQAGLGRFGIAFRADPGAGVRSIVLDRR